MEGVSVKFTKAIAALFCAGLFVVAVPNKSHAVAITWDLLDHGFGALGPFYGLRLDSPEPTGTGATSGPDRLFSFGGASTATLTFDTSGGGSASISGPIIENGNADNAACSGGTVDSANDCSVWDLAYTFTGISVQDVGDPFKGFTATGGSGTVSQQSSSLVLDLGAKSDGSGFTLLWLADGHRLPGDIVSLVGRGWVDPVNGLGSANDFLFTGQVVPEPGTIALFGIGLLGLGVMKRRRRSA